MPPHFEHFDELFISKRIIYAIFAMCIIFEERPFVVKSGEAITEMAVTEM